MAARIFVRIGLGRRHVPKLRQVHEAARRHLLQNGPGHADIGEHDLAAPHAARQQEMPGLQPEERDRQFGLGRISAYRAGRAVEPARHIDRHHAPGGTQRVGDDAVHIARKARAEHGIDHQRRALCLGWGKRRRWSVPSRSGIGRVGTRARWRQCRKRDRPAGLLQQPRRHIAVAAVVAWPCEHKGPAWAEPRPDGARHRPARILHQRRTRDAERWRRSIGMRHFIRRQ